MSPAGDFVVGANLPWLRYGGDFGANAWSPRGGLSQRTDGAAIVSRLESLRSRGVEVLRWFLLCDGRAGLVVEPDGTPVGLDPFVQEDFQTAVDWARRAGLRLLPVLIDFHWCKRARVVNGVTLGGRRTLLAHPSRRAALVDRILAPLFARFGRDPNIYAWDLFNEPEWVTWGMGTWKPWPSISRGALRAYVRLAAERAHTLTVHPVTLGSASVRFLPDIQGLGLDFYSPHWYDRFEARFPLATPVQDLGCDAPVLLGEIPTAGSSRAPETLLAMAHHAGYSGALFWSVNASDTTTDARRAEAALRDWIQRGPDDAPNA